MKLIATFLKLRHHELIHHLVGKGFSFDQAEYFLPVANDSLVYAFNQAGDCNTIKTDRVLAHINIGHLAKDTGIDASLIASGLQSLVPFITAKVCTEGLGDLLHNLKRMF